MDNKAARNAKISKCHPRDEANFLSHYFFCWQLHMLLKKWRKKLDHDDLAAVLKTHDSGCYGDKLETVWNAEKKSSKSPSLTRALLKTFGLKFLTYGVVYFTADTLILILLPYFLTKLLSSYAIDPDSSILLYACLLILVIFFRVCAFNFFLLECYSHAMKFRIACSSLIYRELLHLKKTTIQEITAAKIMNLLSNDIEKIDKMVAPIPYLLITPAKAVVALVFLYTMFGSTSIAGIGVLFLIFLIQVCLLSKVSAGRSRVLSRADYRIRLMNDIINGIQVIKMLACEKWFTNSVKTARKTEISEIAKTNFFRFTSSDLVVYFPKICSFLYVLLTISYGFTLKPEYLYAIVNIHDLLNSTLSLCSGSVNYLSSLRVSLRRLQDFLLASDKSNKSGKSNSPRKGNDEVLLSNVSTTWDTSSKSFILSNVNLRASASELVALVGPPGSGKSTLLQSILKETNLLEGDISCSGTISYASQEPWIFPSTVRQNIIFGEEMDKTKYAEVIRVCALEYDLSLFPHGDSTLVGERGVKLSGGQKARINLARAIYRDADVYLLDDPLSALDARVSDHIFVECILKYLKSKCVVLVTHHIQYLTSVDRIYVLSKGKVAANGKIDQVENLIGTKTSPKEEMHLETNEQSETEVEESTSDHMTKPYRNYCLNQGKWIYSGLYFLVFLVTQALVTSTDYFVAIWVKSENQVEKFLSDNISLYIYGGSILLVAVITHTNNFILVQLCKLASKHLHDGVFDKVLIAPISFFNNHPSGRILNRFSSDVGTIDERLPEHFSQTTRVSFMVLGSIVLVLFLNFWMILPTIVLCLSVYFANSCIQTAIEDFKKIEATRRSPIYTHVSATLQGLTTIRVSKVEKLLKEEFDSYQNLHISMQYLYLAFFFAKGFWIDVFCALFTAVVVFVSLFVDKEPHVSKIGLAITQSFALIGCMQYRMKMSSELDSDFTSVERLVEYSNLTPEVDNGNFVPDETWPVEGKVLFNSVSMQYSPEKPFVLKNISFTIQSGEKVGIVGRTGAGKSSLISVLFRLFEFEGNVYIDGVDTKVVPLSTLRSKIAIIPQEPLLFFGTLRKNLDPFDEFTDSRIWSVLEEVNLKNVVSALPSGLCSIISEGGSNFSVGERQLLCLVRAILRNTKIVALDEATASVDMETDGLIQSVLRRKFKSSTMLIIAHRLDTVMDCHKILVMHAGEVAEFGKVSELVQNTNGRFYKYFYRK